MVKEHLDHQHSYHNSYLGSLDYSESDREKLFCATCDLRFNYMVALGGRCYCLRKTGLCEHIWKHCSVKQLMYVGCSHKTCNSCQVIREKKDCMILFVVFVSRYWSKSIHHLETHIVVDEIYMWLLILMIHILYIHHLQTPYLLTLTN